MSICHYIFCGVYYGDGHWAMSNSSRRIAFLSTCCWILRERNFLHPCRRVPLQRNAGTRYDSGPLKHAAGVTALPCSALHVDGYRCSNEYRTSDERSEGISIYVVSL